MRKNFLHAIFAGIMALLVLITGCASKGTDGPDGAASDVATNAGSDGSESDTSVVGGADGAASDDGVTGGAGDADAAEDVVEGSDGTASDASVDGVENLPLAESSWTVVYDLQITHPTNIAGFLNEGFGITGGPNGEIHYTVDGGQTWPEAENESMCRFCIDIVDENLVWSGGNGNNVRLSRDGGKTWQAVSDISMGSIHSNIDFVDDKTGWIATTKKLASTKDGGATWTEMALPEDVNSIAAVCLRTPNDGYLLSHNGMFFTTRDGGATWSGHDLDMEKFEIVNTKKQPVLDRKDIALADISFTDESNGIIVFTGASPGKVSKTWCLTTTDGGATWIPELMVLADGFSAARVFTSSDCKYITLGSYTDRFLLLKKTEN